MCVTGSTPLVQYLHWTSIENARKRGKVFCQAKRKATNNDIDVFLPTQIDALAKKNQRGKAQIALHFPQIAQVYHACNRKGISIHHLVTIDKHYYKELGCLRRIAYIFNICIANSGMIKDKIQLIFIDTKPSIPNQLAWCDFITESFDIDIVQGIMYHLNRRSCKSIGLKFPRRILKNIDRGNFVFTFKHEQSFFAALARIRKYIEKGFNLKEIKFDESLSPEYVNRMTNRLLCMAGPKEILKKLDAGNKLPSELVHIIINEYLRPHETKYTHELYKISQLQCRLNYLRTNESMDEFGNYVNTRPLKREIRRREKRVSARIIQGTWHRYKKRNKAALVIQRAWLNIKLNRRCTTITITQERRQ